MPFVTLGAHWGAEGALAGHMAGGIAFGLGAVVVVRSLIASLERELGGAVWLTDAGAERQVRAGGS